MGFIKNFFLQLSEQIPLGILKRISPIDIYLPYHHIVSNEVAPYVRHLYSFKNEKQFERDLDYLLKNFKPIQVDDLVAYVRGGKSILPNSFLPTFDDGFRECATVIAPILYRKGVSAIFFLNNNYIGNNKLFYRLKISLLIEHLAKNNSLNPIYRQNLGLSDSSIVTSIDAIKTLNQSKEHVLDQIATETGFNFDKFLNDVQPFLNEADVDNLVSMGFSIGGHSLSHPYFQFLSEEEQVHEAVHSTKQLADRYHQKHLLFSFPHSDKVIRTPVIQGILDQGIDVLFGIQNQLPELQYRMLHRFNAERPGIPIKRQIKAEMLHTAILKATGRYRVNRQ